LSYGCLRNLKANIF